MIHNAMKRLKLCSLYRTWTLYYFYVCMYLFICWCIILLFSVPALACEKFVWVLFYVEFNVCQNTLRTSNEVQWVISQLIMNNVNLVHFYGYTLCSFGTNNWQLYENLWFDLQLDALNSCLFTYNIFIKLLYMFRALTLLIIRRSTS